METRVSNPTNKIQRYIFEEERKWFSRIQPFLYGKILKIGSGLGYMSSFVYESFNDLIVLEVKINSNDGNKDKVVIYNGIHLPFMDNSFDCVMACYVLHHTPYPNLVLKEMKRVGKRIIVLEETYTNFESKKDLVYRDLYVNGYANQTSQIYLGSYFKKEKIEGTLSKSNFSIVFHQVEKKRLYFKELFVLDNTSLKKTSIVIKNLSENFKCPKCKKGEVVVKSTKKGKKFYGCSRYPDCQWASWRKPGTEKEKEAEKASNQNL